MSAFENNHAVFDIIVKKYNEYLRLYRLVNHGSAEGVTPFADFYWRFVYETKYADPALINRHGY